MSLCHEPLVAQVAQNSGYSSRVLCCLLLLLLLFSASYLLNAVYEIRYKSASPELAAIRLPLD